MAKGITVEASVRLDDVLRWRVARQFLGTGQATDLVEVARRVCGLHAQLASSAVHAARLRAPVDADAVDRALLHDRTLVKTWAVRGTLHLLPAADLPTWVAALSTRRAFLTTSWTRYHGVSAGDVTALLSALPDALGDASLTREELADRLVEVTGRDHLRDVLMQGWGALLKPAAYRGLLCFGPPRGRNVTFVAPSAWLPAFVAPGPSDAGVDELVLTYLATYGPASLDWFCRWSALDARTARVAFARLGDRLAWVDVDGQPGAVRREDLAELRDPPSAGTPVVRLLPAFDPYVVGSLRQLDRVVAGAAGNAALVSRPQGWISPVLMVDGKILGTWTREGGRTTVSRFAPVPRAAGAALRVAQEELGALR